MKAKPFAIISKGNDKLRHICNVSHTPGESCGNVPCFEDGCYAKGNCRRFKNVRLAWGRNLRNYRKDPDRWFESLADQLERINPLFFRYHVGGDVQDRAYLKRMVKLAERTPQTAYLCFTKRYRWAITETRMGVPDNLQLILSAWPGWPIPDDRAGLPVAWMDDGRETRFDRSRCLVCPGNCESCGMCWQLSKVGRDVVFARHDGLFKAHQKRKWGKS